MQPATATIADSDFESVFHWLSRDARTAVSGIAIRRAIDWVIDGARTRRYSIDQLQTGEKVYIGNRVEHELLYEWGLTKEGDLDCIIEGIPVDIKFSLSKSWMIPPEAVNQLCIIATADDHRSTFSIGLLRAKPECLGAGTGNRDKKLGITIAGQKQIRWISRDAKMRPNFLLHLSNDVREKIFKHKSGTQRVIELFRQVIGVPIPTTAVDTVAVQRDPSKRIRDNGGARGVLINEGIVIYGDRYDQQALAKMGCPPLEKDHWISIKVADDKAGVLRIIKKLAAD